MPEIIIKMQISDLLRNYYGYDFFRPNQEAIIREVMQGNDCLVLMPTGGGKSICYQIPALALPGTAVVVSPLISLMHDQVETLKANGIAAAELNSNNDSTDEMIIRRRCMSGDLKLIYVSPEKLISEIPFLFSNIKISLFAIDEAHCISQWGYDFRPSYLEIAKIRQLLPEIPILALTATATPAVVEDIQRQLQFRTPNVYKMSFARANLSYIVRRTMDKEAELVHILRQTSGSAIVYTRSREATRELAKMLMQQGISATWYHAGLEPSVKEERQNLWQTDKVRVMVATNAFGMGIDKPDVSMVIHPDAPNSIEEYFQEAGRAGRDGNQAYAVLLYEEDDAHKLKCRVASSFPEKELIRTIYNQIAYFFVVGVGCGAGHTFEFSLERFCRAYRHFPTQVHTSLELLQRAGYIYYDPNPDSKARLRFLLQREDLYRLDHSTPKENAVITALLRMYGDLFVDFSFIDESFVAKEANLSREETYTTLRALDQKHIVKFIPRKNIPLITYRKDRIDGEDLIIGPEVYEDRKADFEKRILAMIDYCENESECRSRQLLRYFGETESEDCGHCDVCRARRKESSDEALRQAILQQLADRKGHALAEIKALFGHVKAGQVLNRLMAEEQVATDGSKIWLKD